MKFYQPVVTAILFLLFFIIVISCIPSVIASWEETDGIKLEVPRRMANLLKKITKHELNWVGNKNKNGQTDSMDLKTTLQSMHLNGLRTLNPTRRKKNTTTELWLKRTMESNERKPGRRQKRAASTRKLKTTKVCHSGRIDVNLTKYSNIMAPLGFKTHYCGSTYQMPIGGDPVTKIVSQAIMDAFNQMHSFSKSVFENSRCCGPLKTKNLVVLYHDPKKHYSMIKYFQKLIVVSCGCSAT